MRVVNKNRLQENKKPQNPEIMASYRESKKEREEWKRMSIKEVRTEKGKRGHTDQKSI